MKFINEFTPKKSLGQNFLVNPRILDKIVAAAEITKEDTVLEVGPGTGNLTEKLAERAERVVAIEKDERLIGFLKNKFSENYAIAGKSEIIEGDVLKINAVQLSINNNNYKIVANIPYYITSRFIRKVFEGWPKPKLIVLTIQKEVAQRIVAKPPKMNPVRGKTPLASAGHAQRAGRTSNGMNLLAVSVQFFAEPKILGYISKENFRPRPKVDSAIIKLTPKEKLPTDDIEKFFKLVRAGFSQKRKMLIGNLAEKLKLKKEILLEIFKKLKINPKTRAENLALEDWIMISENL